MWGLPGAVLSVPLLAIGRVVLQRTDHPLAKRLLHIIRETAKDELLEMLRKREGFWKPNSVRHTP